MTPLTNNIQQVLGESEAGGFSFGWGPGLDAEISFMKKGEEYLLLPDGSPIFEISVGLPVFGRNYGAEVHSHVKGETVDILVNNSSQ